jgi:type VI secretion system protein ImpE
VPDSIFGQATTFGFTEVDVQYTPQVADAREPQSNASSQHWETANEFHTLPEESDRMNAVSESIRNGDLEGALAGAQALVRQAFSDPKHHVLLFQVQAVLGQWSKALSQLAILEEMAPAMAPMVQTYRIAIKCEEFRASVFQGQHTPLLLGQPGQWMALLLQSLRMVALGKPQEATELRDSAFEAAPSNAGTIDGVEFQWLADADPRMGPVLEAIVNGKYYWIPLSNVSAINIEKPTDLRDLVWIPSTLTLTNGGETVALLPVRYPGSEASVDSAIRLARKTEWVGPESGPVTGLGQRMFATDGKEYPLLDTRSIQFHPAAASPSS